MSERWETVPNRSMKKPIAKTNGTTKRPDEQYNQSSQFDAPKVPVFEEKSQYDVLIPKEKKVKPKDSESKKIGDSVKPKSGIPRLQKKDGPKKSAPKARLETLLPSMTEQEFEDIYSKSQALVKGNPLHWLKELTGQLNSKLDEVPQSDPVFTNHPEDFPSCLLNLEVRKVFNKSINACSGELLQLFIEQLIQSVMTEMGKGLSVYGYQIVAQLLARHKPDFFAQNTAKYLDLIVNNKNVPAKCLTVMWILGQGGCHDFRSGLKVWTGLMLHTIGIKTLASYSVEYLGQILRKAGSKGVEHGYGVIDMKSYFLLLDGVFTASSNVQAPIQKRIKGYYPALKTLAFGKNPQKIVQKFFPSYLTRLTGAGSGTELQNELLQSIVFCLAADPQCFNVWQQLYPKNLVQSSIVLNSLADNWKQNASLGVNYTVLGEMVKAFVTTNTELNKATPGLEACMLACARFEEIHNAKMEEGISTVMLAFIFCLLTAASLVAADSYQNGGFGGSRTRKMLADTGVDVYMIKLFTVVGSYLSKITSFLFKNVPKWTETAMVYVEPAFDLLWNYLVIVVKYLIEISEPVRAWIAENVPYFINWIVMHPAWEVLYNYLKDFWVVVEPYVEIVLRNANMLMDRVRLTLSHYIS